MQSDKRPEWIKLKEVASQKRPHLSSYFSANDRFSTFSLKTGHLLFDFSKNHIDSTTLSQLSDLLQASNFNEKRNGMLKGEILNPTENRAVMHPALRLAFESDANNWISDDIASLVRNEGNRMLKAVDEIHHAGKIKHVVNIGIGGSDLGCRFLTDALKDYHIPTIQVHYVSNVDAAPLLDLFKILNPEETLFVIASKTFTTQETISNAKTARNWIVNALGESKVNEHFIAISTAAAEVQAFGIDPSNMFGFWDWVGGRFSLWSSIGMPLALAIGSNNFRNLLSGAASADKHFFTEPISTNIPAVAAMIDVWYATFLDYPSKLFVPYAHRMNLLASFLQQLIMESNGKSVDLMGEAINYSTSPVVFGTAGTDAQHSYFQLLHQGTVRSHIDFIGFKNQLCADKSHTNKLLSNLLAQSNAFMMGFDSVDNTRKFDGDKPSNTWILNNLDPFTLGQFLAFQEHRVFVQGILWNINSFDQFGVELGKRICNQILPVIEENQTPSFDDSTNGLFQYLFQ